MDFLDVHTHKTARQKGVESIQSLSLTSDVFLAMPKTRPISLGLHPWYAKLDRLEIQLKYLSVLAKQPNVKLIGECGLDKLRGESLENQTLILAQQVTLAQELNKPLILHCVRAFAELILLKERLQIGVPMIIHGFNKSEELGRQLINKGFLLSFGETILKQDSGAAKLLAQNENFFLETDDSEITIGEIYQAAANLKKCSVDELKARIFVNWKALNLL